MVAVNVIGGEVISVAMTPVVPIRQPQYKKREHVHHDKISVKKLALDAFIRQVNITKRYAEWKFITTSQISAESWHNIGLRHLTLHYSSESVHECCASRFSTWPWFKTFCLSHPCASTLNTFVSCVAAAAVVPQRSECTCPWNLSMSAAKGPVAGLLKQVSNTRDL